MSRRLDVSPHADEDTDDIFWHIFRDDSDAALRFLNAARNAFDRLCEMPGIGTMRETGLPGLEGLRSWPVPGFRNYVVFYLADDEVVMIVRVLHGARDIEAILSNEAGER